MEERKTFFEYCKEHLLERLDEYVGTTHYACDLGFILNESENADGTLTYSTYEAKEYLKLWWDDAAEYWDYEKFNFGEHLHNPFDKPEAYMVCMVIEGVRSILSQCNSIDEAWNDEVELTEEFCARLRDEIEEVSEIQW